MRVSFPKTCLHGTSKKHKIVQGFFLKGITEYIYLFIDFLSCQIDIFHVTFAFILFIFMFIVVMFIVVPMSVKQIPPWGNKGFIHSSLINKVLYKFD